MKQKRLRLQQQQQLPTTTIRIRAIIIIFPSVCNYRHMGECMHRLWQHTISIDMDIDHTTTTTTTISTDNDDDDDKDDVVTTKLMLLVIFTIPQGMFVDLDDPIPWKESGRITTTNCIPPRYVCDIEQPAFVSGQHVLVLEISIPISKSTSSIIMPMTTTTTTTTTESFATKLHLR
jgi:hypothetical protein